MRVRAGGLALAQEIVVDRDALRSVGGFADPTSDVRLLTEAMTLDTSDQQVAQAYARMVNNMVDPLPPKPITTEEAKTPTGLSRIASRQVDATRRSASHAVFTYLGDMTVPTGGSALADWAKNATGPAYPNTVGDKVSKLQAMDIFVHSRFPNPDWHQQLAKMSPDAVMRELALTQALNLYVNWERYNLERRVAAVNAATLSTLIDGTEGASHRCSDWKLGFGFVTDREKSEEASTKQTGKHRWRLGFRGRQIGKLFRMSNAGVEFLEDLAENVKPKRLDLRGLKGRYPDGGLQRFKDLTRGMSSTDIQRQLDGWIQQRTVYQYAALLAILAIPVGFVFFQISRYFAGGLVALFLFSLFRAVRADFFAWIIEQGRFGGFLDYLTTRLPRNMHLILPDRRKGSRK